MFGRIVLLIIFAISLAACASQNMAWYKQYGIPDREALAKQESIPKLIRALDDENAETRANASEALGTFGQDAVHAGEKLYTLRINDNSGTVRLFAHYALKEIFADEYDGQHLTR